MKKRYVPCTERMLSAVTERICQRRFVSSFAGDFLSISSEYKHFYVRFPHTKWRLEISAVSLCIYAILIEVFFFSNKTH